MEASAHRDTFARDHLPPRDLWPDLLIPEGSVFDYPDRLNGAVELLDRTVEAGGDRVLFHTDDGAQTYAEFLADVNRIAHVLVADLGLDVGALTDAQMTDNHGWLLFPNFFMTIRAAEATVTAGRAEIALDTDRLDRRYGLAVEPEPRPAITVELPLPMSHAATEVVETLVEDVLGVGVDGRGGGEFVAVDVDRDRPQRLERLDEFLDADPGGVLEVAGDGQGGEVDGDHVGPAGVDSHGRAHHAVERHPLGRHRLLSGEGGRERRAGGKVGEPGPAQGHLDKEGHREAPPGSTPANDVHASPTPEGVRRFPGWELRLAVLLTCHAVDPDRGFALVQMRSSRLRNSSQAQRSGWFDRIQTGYTGVRSRNEAKDQQGLQRRLHASRRDRRHTCGASPARSRRARSRWPRCGPGRRPSRCPCR